MLRASPTPLFLALLALAPAAGPKATPRTGHPAGGQGGGAPVFDPGADGLVYPGHAAFSIRAPLADGQAPVQAPLAKPILRDGRLEPGYFIVHFRGAIAPLDKAWLDELTGPVRREDGSELARWYLPDDALVAWVDTAAIWSALERSERTDWVGRYQPAYKLDPVWVGEAFERGLESVPRLLNLDLVPGHAAARVRKELATLGVRVLEEVHHRGQAEHDLRFLVVEAAPRIWAEVARVEGIRLVQERADPVGFTGEGYPSELDARGAAELARRARLEGRLSGRRPDATHGAGYDQVSALLDLLAFDDPELSTWIEAEPGGGESPLDTPLKNGLVVDRRRPNAFGGSGACVRALAVHAALGETARSFDGGELRRAPLVSRLGDEREGPGWIVLDVPRSEGFRAPAEAPHTYTLHATGQAEDLSLTLAWTDEPGGAGPGKKLINDLDLLLRAPDGTFTRGNRFDDTGASVNGARGDSNRTVESIVLPRPAGGDWTVIVQPVRGAFSEPQGYALVVTGDGFQRADSRQPLVAPTTLTLRVKQGLHSKDGNLNETKMARLLSSDNDRLTLLEREQLTLAFDRTVPANAIVSALRVFVEHHELSRVRSGDILWRIGRGPLTGPILLESRTAPLRGGPGAEGLDTWLPELVPDPNDLTLVIEGMSQEAATLLDQVYVEVDYLLPGLAPQITSIPNTVGVAGQTYAYDADHRAEASGGGPITWSAPSAPAGLTVQATTGLVSWTPASTGSFSIALRAANASGASTQSFVVQVQAELPFPATLLPTNATSIPYVPPERLALGPAKPQQRLNVFLPPGEPPPDGWPVLVNNRAGGGLATVAVGALRDSDGTSPLHAFVATGIAVVDFGVTGIGSGQGLFYPPGHPSGRYESFHPADDTPEKDAEWAIQWVKTQPTFPLDGRRMCVRGASEGAIIPMWAAMGPPRARTSGSPQVRASTRVKAVLALQPPTSIWAFDQQPTLESRMIQHLEQAAFPGVPATGFGQATEALQKAASIMGFAFASAAARTHNETQAICMLYADPVKKSGGLPVDLSLDASGFPRLHDTLGRPYIHDSWAGYVLYKRLIDLSPRSAAFHAAHSIFAIRDTSALAPPFAYHTRTYGGNAFGSQANALAHAWVRERLSVKPPKLRALALGTPPRVESR